MRTTQLTRAAGVFLVLPLFIIGLTGGAASAAELVGRAVLSADTFAVGPTSGQFIDPANGRVPPFVRRQPAQGFSSVLRAKDGDFLVMCDNGFGTKANSADYDRCRPRLQPQRPPPSHHLPDRRGWGDLPGQHHCRR
jgi:hypothetical protein